MRTASNRKSSTTCKRKVDTSHGHVIYVRDFLRDQEALYRELQLATRDDAALLDALTAHPQLLKRPVASSADAVRIGRPAERVLELLP